MKRLLCIAAATIAVSACGSKSEPAPEPVETTAAPIETAAPAAATGNISGEYEIKLADGTVTRQTINADGTYVDKDVNGTQTETGTWRQQGSQLCFDPEGTDPEACYAGGTPAADGSFEMRDAAGAVVSTVRKVEG